MAKVGLLLGLFLLASNAAAQDVIKNLSPDDFEKIVREDLRKDFAKQASKGGFTYDIKGTPYFVQFSTAGKFLIFYAITDGRKTTLERINTWNKDAIFSRAYLLNNEVHFEVAMTFAGGVTRENIKDCYDRTELEWKDFNEKVLK